MAIEMAVKDIVEFEHKGEKLFLVRGTDVCYNPKCSNYGFLYEDDGKPGRWKGKSQSLRHGTCIQCYTFLTKLIKDSNGSVDWKRLADAGCCVIKNKASTISAVKRNAATDWFKNQLGGVESIATEPFASQPVAIETPISSEEANLMNG